MASILDLFDKLITEHGSATILKERISFIKEKYEDMDARLEAKNQELDRAGETIRALTAENEKLRRQIPEATSSELTDPQTLTVLTFMFEYGDETPADFVAYSLSLPKNIVDYHIGKLRSIGYVQQSRVRSSHVESQGLDYRVTQKGMEFCIRTLSGK